jgi:hypothetical protein
VVFRKKKDAKKGKRRGGRAPPPKKKGNVGDVPIILTTWRRLNCLPQAYLMMMMMMMMVMMMMMKLSPFGQLGCGRPLQEV